MIVSATGACAVKGYDLGWRDEDPIAPLLGRPLDALADCRSAEGAPAPVPACAGLVRELGDLVAALPPLADAPTSLGARCAGRACSYSNAYLRRDVGLALVVPVFRKNRAAGGACPLRPDGRRTLAARCAVRARCSATDLWPAADRR